MVGGVDNPSNYGNFTSGQKSPLRANQLPVPDPFVNLPAPTVAVDPANVSATTYGGVQVTGVPLISPAKVLNPGVYDWIEIVSGAAVFNPGVYIIRSVNPTTQIGLNVTGGIVTANGVMFYITNTTNYTPLTGAPDASDGNTVAPPPTAMTQIPSVVIASLLGSSYQRSQCPGQPLQRTADLPAARRSQPDRAGRPATAAGGNSARTGLRKVRPDRASRRTEHST